MGFGNKWQRWIQLFVSMVWFSVIVNGTQMSLFNSSRGLRQCKPLSPLLYILVIEELNQMLKRIGRKFH